MRTSQFIVQDVLLTRAGQGSVERTNPKEKMPIGYSIASISVAPMLSSIVGTVVPDSRAICLHARSIDFKGLRTEFISRYHCQDTEGILPNVILGH